MPRIDNDTPKLIRPFVSLSLDLTDKGDQWWGDCPFCGKEGKWTVSAETSQWECKSCGENGNSSTFLVKFHAQSLEATATSDYEEFAVERTLLDPTTLVEWGVCKSSISGEWLVPAYSPSGSMCNLYRYGKAGQKYRLQSLGGLNAGLFAPMGSWDQLESSSTAGVAEGVWDAMCLWETLQSTPDRDRPFVVGVPGANTFPESWCRIFGGKNVWLLYHNDHPRTNPKTGQVVSPPGWEGVKRAAGLMANSSSPPSQILRLCWLDGDQDSTHNPDLADGYDVRDYLGQGDTDGRDGLEVRATLASELFHRLYELPSDVVSGSTTQYKADDPEYCLSCESWKDLVQAWRKSGLEWIEGLDRALSVMLACVLSTEAMGDQLWARVLAPPGGGKTTLCEALAMSRQFVYSMSVFTGFHSGKRGEDGKDLSMLTELKNKTFVIKDGDTLLKLPNRDQVLSEMRDVYDRVSRSRYRTGAGGVYEGLNMTVILCGTGSLLQLDTAELGERYITCAIMNEIDDELEDEIIRRSIDRAFACLGVLSNGKVESQDTPEMVLAKRMTGGYVGFLRRNAERILRRVTVTDEDKEYIAKLGKFTAHMRARPSKKQDEEAERELATRLSGQFSRLCGCLAAVMGKTTIDSEVMRRVRRCAIDSSRGKVLRLCQQLYRFQNEDGIQIESLVPLVHEDEKPLRALLTFLRAIGVTDLYKPSRERARWRLTDRMEALYHAVVELDQDGN
jgi:hypothetical protein